MKVIILKWNIPTQQSALLYQLLPVIPVARQLFVPQTRVPAHSLSSSQSPSLTLHWLVVVQQLQSVIGIPLQFGATVGAGVVVVVVAVDIANIENNKRLLPRISVDLTINTLNPSNKHLKHYLCSSPRLKTNYFHSMKSLFDSYLCRMSYFLNSQSPYHSHLLQRHKEKCLSNSSNQ